MHQDFLKEIVSQNIWCTCIICIVYRDFCASYNILYNTIYIHTEFVKTIPNSIPKDMGKTYMVVTEMILETILNIFMEHSPRQTGR